MWVTHWHAGNTVQKLAPDERDGPLFSAGELNGPVGLTYDNDDQLYVASFTDRKVFRIDDDELIQIIQLPRSGSLGFMTFAMDHIFAKAFTNDKIYKVNPFFQDSVVAVYGGNQATIGPRRNSKVIARTASDQAQRRHPFYLPVQWGHSHY